MTFNFAIVLLLIVSASRTSAQTSASNSAGQSIIGAVYTMSNEANSNKIIVYSINSNGQLVYSKTVNTNGLGFDASSGSDPGAYSRNSMQVYQNYLFATNIGSRSLSMFLIDTSNVTSLQLVAVQSVFSTYPISVAVNSVYVCVLSISISSTGIRCFTYGASGLTQRFDYDLTNYVNGTASRNGTLYYPKEILFSSDNTTLFVSMTLNYGSQSQIIPLQLNNDGFTVKSSIPVGYARRTLSMTLIGTNRLLAIADGTPLLVWYSSATGENSITQSLPSGLPGIQFPTYSRLTDTYYGLSGTSTIISLKANFISPQTNLLQYIVQSLPSCSNNQPIAVAVVSQTGTDYMFVLDSSFNSISTYQIQNGSSITSKCYILPVVDYVTFTQTKGIAAYILPSTPSSAARSILSSTILILISALYIS